MDWQTMYWAVNLILCQAVHLACAATPVFKVTGPQSPMVAMVGGVAVLECQLIPERLLPEMEIRWLRSDARVHTVVHLYRKGDAVKEDQDPAYRGRTQLYRDQLTIGNVSLRLSAVRLSDEGDYLCMVEHERVIEQAAVPLKVTSLGVRPVLRLEGYQDDGIRVLCNSSGWFPLPSLLWTVAGGKDGLKGSGALTSKDDAGFYRISSSVEVTRGLADLRCQVRAPLLDQPQESRIDIPDEFFPRVSKYFTAFIVFLVILILLMSTAIFYYCWKRNKAKELYKRPTLEKHKTVSEAIADLENLTACARINLELERNLCTEAAERVIGAAVRVSFDPLTANPYLVVSEDCLTVSFKEEWGSGREDDEMRFTARLFVMAKDGYRRGTQYWEVFVGNKPDWDMGVAVQDLPRHDWVTLCPENRIWAIGKRGLNYDANCDPPLRLEGSATAQTIGVYLNRDLGLVRFYDAENLAHIYSFRADFNDEIFPFFSPWGSQYTMEICTPLSPFPEHGGTAQLSQASGKPANDSDIHV
ncbi:butyrophilin subfamily 3 member A3-like [Rhinoraja longicauda]